MARIYIAGRMNGIKDLNFPFFEEVTYKLRHKGYDVVSPVEVGRKHFRGKVDSSQQDYLIKDIQELLTCDTICLLAGWEAGTGAVCEAAIAKTLSFFFLYADYVRVYTDDYELQIVEGPPPDTISITRCYPPRDK